MDLESNIVDLESCPGVTDVDHALIHELRGYVDDIIISVVKIKKVDLPPVEEDVREIEYIRYCSRRFEFLHGTVSEHLEGCFGLVIND